MAVVIGVTGGIGTGKSTVLAMLRDLGAQTISADDVAREVVAPGGAAYDAVIGRFGREILHPDGSVDRAALARIVFQDEQARRDLEAVTHPPIINRIQEQIDRFRRNPPSQNAVLAVEIPLLIECGLQAMVDQVLLVVAEQRAQIDRLTSRSGMRPEQAVQRIQAQMPLESKIPLADWVVYNDADMTGLEEKVRRLWAEILLL